MSDEIIVPPFIQEYINEVDGEGLSGFIKLSSEYQKEMQDYPGKFQEQQIHLEAHNRRTGQNRTLDYEAGKKGIKDRYERDAYKLAKQYGYKGPDPNPPADKNFTKQGEKFQGMIDKARQNQSQREQSQLSGTMSEAKAGKESDTVKELKDQQSYKQNSAKVNFKSAEQLSGSDKQNREQQRIATLDQIKKAREQQSQQEKNKERER